MLVYFSAIWYMLLSFGKLYVHLVHFVVNFGTFLTVNNLAALVLRMEVRKSNETAKN
jgi:hypothetical protein